MMDMTEPVVAMAETATAKAAGAVADHARDDPADSDQADDADDQAEPFRVRCRERQGGQQHSPQIILRARGDDLHHHRYVELVAQASDLLALLPVLGA